jgi:hypothetical protein
MRRVLALIFIKYIEYSQGNSQLKYPSQKMVELKISDINNILRLKYVKTFKKKKSAPLFSDVGVENFLEKTQKVLRRWGLEALDACTWMIP